MIHPSAIIDPGAQLGARVSVGAFSIIGPKVRIGDDTRIGPHVVIEGDTAIGRDNRIFQFATIGSIPQDKKYQGEPTRLEVGDRNTIREYCSLNSGTAQDGAVTRVGNDNWVMAYVHIAHDCQIGNDVILANATQLAGHVHIGDHVILGGLTGVHQFVKIGAHSMTGGGTILFQDLPPYVLAQGNPAKPYTVNVEGLKRRGFTPSAIEAVRRAYRILYRSSLSLTEARQKIEEEAVAEPALGVLAGFLAKVERGILR